jgi:hypothetical protein
MGREQWLAERRKGIGGSDWRHVLSIEPYGCRRRLWYDKSGIEPDYPEQETGAMKRGKKLERLVVEEFVEVHNRAVWYPDDSVDAAADFFEHFGQAAKIGGRPLPVWWRGTPDGAILPLPDEKQPGVLEVKTKGPWPFAAVKKDGAPAEEVAQVMHYLGTAGWAAGTIAYFEPVNWSLFPIAVDRDEAVLDQMVTEGNEFWHREVEEGIAPDQLDPRSKQCKGCPWLPTCQGDLSWEGTDEAEGDYEPLADPAVAAMVAERIAISAVLKDGEAALAEINESLVQIVGAGRKILTKDQHKVRISDGTYSTQDNKKFEADYPRIFSAIKERYKVKRKGNPSVYVYPKRKEADNG